MVKAVFLHRADAIYDDRPAEYYGFPRQYLCVARAANVNEGLPPDLGLRNGGGRREVQAAHIRPVEAGGNDDVRDGIALSGTLHWMFDRGLISIEPDSHRILVSHNKVPGDVAARLIVPDQRLRLPRDQRDWPHPANLAWHRENRFWQGKFGM